MNYKTWSWSHPGVTWGWSYDYRGSYATANCSLPYNGARVVVNVEPTSSGELEASCTLKELFENKEAGHAFD